MRRKLRCNAKLILGENLGQMWSSCKLRLNGLCCKDCKKLDTCRIPCSLLARYYDHAEDKFKFKNFNCEYYCTKMEALFKRITNERGH